jgi:hypothetical protein
VHRDPTGDRITAKEGAVAELFQSDVILFGLATVGLVGTIVAILRDYPPLERGAGEQEAVSNSR